MQRRRRRWAFGTVASVVAAVLLPGLAMGTGPVRIANGQPGNDTQLSVLTPAQAAFMDRKRAIATAIAQGGAAPTRVTDEAIPAVPCELDPCEGTPPPTPPPSGAPTPPPPPPPPGLPAAKTLATRARQQNNYYFCGPATGQVVINWSRGIINGNNDGEDAATNWRKQSKIAEWMKTTKDGTGGANLAVGLNNPNAVLKPTPDWIYIYDDIGTMQEFYGKVVADIAEYSMPLVLATAPHLSGAGQNYLESWPNVAPGAHHWIVLRGYDGLPGSPAPIVKYQDSSAGFGGATGAFDDTLGVVWQVSKYNQGGHVVW